MMNRSQITRETSMSCHVLKNDADSCRFDSSRDRGRPLTFPLGKGRVIAGWDEGVAQMKKGEQATLIIPPAKGYGAQGESC